MIKKDKLVCYFVLSFVMFLWACNSTRLNATSSFTEVPHDAVITTEHGRQTQSALAQTILPTVTFMPTITPTPPIALVPTLTAILNSTPVWKGAYFNVPSDAFGSQYEIENAYYFDDGKTGERFEFYAGAVAGSGTEETAQGVMVLRILRFSKELGSAEVIATQEYLTPIQAGPLRIKVNPVGSILLFTPLHFEWAFSVRHREMVNLGNPPLARMEVGQESQLAGRGSFCWQGTCADFGVYTSSIPLVVHSPFTAHLHLPLVDTPDGLRLRTMMVAPPGSLEYETISDDEASWSSEIPGRELSDYGELLLRRDQEIKLSLEPGYHVLVISAAWHDYGDIQYGFLVEVQE
jgi:hypothetical protein